MLFVVIIFEWYSHISTMSRNDMFFIYVIAKFSFLPQPFQKDCKLISMWQSKTIPYFNIYENVFYLFKFTTTPISV